MRLYYYKSGTNPQFDGPFESGRLLNQDGSLYTFPDGTQRNILYAPEPAAGIYEAILADNAAPDAYYRRGDPAITLSFEGAESQASGRVRETNNWESLTLQEIYEVKQQEIANQDRRVMYNAVDTSLSVNWWIVVTETIRHQIATLNDSALNRKIDGQAWPSGPNQPFLTIYNTVSMNVRRERIPNEGTWETIILEIAQHDQETGNATEASGDALDVAYDNGNGTRADVVAHDAQDPAWGYPPTVELQGPQAAIFL